MKTHSRHLFLALALSSAFSSFARAEDEPAIRAEELARASFTADCASTRTLYRGVNRGFFDLFRSARVLLGDERAEHASWAITTKLQSMGKTQEDLSEYRKAKREAIALWASQYPALHQAKGCWIDNFQDKTWRFGGLGIYATTGLAYTQTFGHYEFGRSDTAILKIVHHQRAGTIVYPGVEESYDIIPAYISHEETEAVTVGDLRVSRAAGQGTLEIALLAEIGQNRAADFSGMRIATVAPCTGQACEVSCADFTQSELSGLCENLKAYNLDGQRFVLTDGKR